MKTRIGKRAVLLIAAVMIFTATSTYLRADTGTCGGASVMLPFTDVSASNIFFCSIAGAYFTGLTNGTSATTYSPSDAVTREQMAAFITRTLNQSLKRGNRRAALNQWALPSAVPFSAKTTVGDDPWMVASDGADLWVANLLGGSVSRVRGCDGKSMETWTGATGACGVLVARGRIFVTGNLSPLGKLYEIDPRNPAGAVSTLATLPVFAKGITTDGNYIWTANIDSVSKVNPDNGAVTTYLTSTDNYGILFDGVNIWVASEGDNSLKKLSSTGAVLDSVPLGGAPYFPIFDGTNIWVPVANNSVVVVRAGGSLTGANRILATLTGNGLSDPRVAAFDGERIAVTNISGDEGISVWNAADLTPIGFYSAGSVAGPVDPYGICSDGVNFWITFQAQDMLARF